MWDLKLPVGDPASFTVKVRAMEDFPLDLYFLADMSFSLRDDLNTMKTIANDIGVLYLSLIIKKTTRLKCGLHFAAQTIEDISSRFQVGLGTFVDKLTPPFVSDQRLK